MGCNYTPYLPLWSVYILLFGIKLIPLGANRTPIMKCKYTPECGIFKHPYGHYRGGVIIHPKFGYIYTPLLTVHPRRRKQAGRSIAMQHRPQVLKLIMHTSHTHYFNNHSVGITLLACMYALGPCHSKLSIARARL